MESIPVYMRLTSGRSCFWMALLIMLFIAFLQQQFFWSNWFINAFKWRIVFNCFDSYRNHDFSPCSSWNLLLRDTPWRWRNWKLPLQRPIIPCRTTAENPDAWQKGFNPRTLCLFASSDLPARTAQFLIIIGYFYFSPLGHDHIALTLYNSGC